MCLSFVDRFTAVNVVVVADDGTVAIDNCCDDFLEESSKEVIDREELGIVTSDLVAIASEASTSCDGGCGCGVVEEGEAIVVDNGNDEDEELEVGEETAEEEEELLRPAWMEMEPIKDGPPPPDDDDLPSKGTTSCCCCEEGE